MPKQNLQCPFCPKTSSHGAGLASHIRGTHPRQYRGWVRSRRSAQPPATGVPDGLNSVITSLEQQKSAIERALSALRDIEMPGVESGVERPQPRQKVRSKRRGGITPEGRKRLAEAMKRRWAIKRTRAQAKTGRRKRAA